ncbi:MAG: hypothetical protein AAGK00_05815 [Pseudomonadota bacterium]
MTALLIVRAQVPPEDRTAFDQWYQDEHLPDAHRVFGALSAQRGWVEETPGLHVALYTFPDLAAAQATVSGPGIQELIAEFDRVWQGRVSRTREVMEIAQTI